MLIITILALATTALSQKYPFCPGGVPVDVGNTTDIYYQKILGLTDFMDYHSQGKLLQAFQQYALTGDQNAIEEVVSENRTFFISITTILGLSSILLFVIMVKMDNIKLTKKQLFQKIKQHNFSSPLSAFYTLIAFILLASICATAYLVATMVTSLQMTQCRLDVLNEVFLNGQLQQDWIGFNHYTQKLQLVKNVSLNINSSMMSGIWTNQNQSLAYSQYNINQLMTAYSGIVNSHSSAAIIHPHNISQNISITTLVPDLFVSATDNSSQFQLHPLLNYFNFLEQTLSFFKLFDHLVTRIAETNPFSLPILQSKQRSLQNQSSAYSGSYLALRTHLHTFFQSSRTTFLISQIMIGFTIFGSVVSMFTLKLIQNNYDFFSIKVYKIIWGCLLILFCLNLIFLLLFNQVMVYNKGLCQFSHSVLSNRTQLQHYFPQTKINQPMYYFASCYFASDFANLTQTQQLVSPIQQYLRYRQNFEKEYRPVDISTFLPLLDEVKNNIRAYQFGEKGLYPALDNELSSINQVTNTNYHNQSCFKHRWKYSPKTCDPSESAGLKPPSVAYLNHNPNYNSQISQCYILNDYPYNNKTPSAHTYDSFFALYSQYIQQCPYTVHQLATNTVTFFNLYQQRVNIFQSIIDSLQNMTTLISTTSSHLLTYLNARQPFLTATLQNIPDKMTHSYLSQGNQCGITKHIANGVYNQFCLNLRALSNKVYLLMVCNVCYIIILIIFSLLYAVQLRNLSQKDLKESYHNMQFMPSQDRISSDSQSDLMGSQQKSTNTHSSGQVPEQHH